MTGGNEYNGIPSLTLGRPVFILPKIDIENEEEKRKMERFELLVKAFDDLPKPKPVMFRCYIDKEELKNERVY